MLKVALLQKTPRSAGSAAIRLHRAFIENEVDSNILFLNKGNVQGNSISFLGKNPKALAWLDDKIQSYLRRGIKKEFGLFSYPVLGSNMAHRQEIKEADVIYLHWVLGGFLSLNSFKQLAKLGKPIIFFIHDMWAITGGCHYSFSCVKYQTQCGNCQMYASSWRKDLAYRGFQKKLQLYSSFDNFYFVSPSRWLARLARQSFLTKDKPVFHIPNVIDSTIFQSIDKAVAKKMFGISERETVIGFGAASVNSPYKGSNYLLQALNLLKKERRFERITVLMFGSNHGQDLASAIPFKTKSLGYLGDIYSMILVYNAIDVFVVPSLADNLPTTILESMCCGTAVVGFDTGGIPEMIQHQENGYLARYKDAEDLSLGIQYCLDHEIKGSLLPSFEKSRVMQQHLDLIEEIS